MQVMLMRLMSKGEYLIVPKGTKFTGSGKLGLTNCSHVKLLTEFWSVLGFGTELFANFEALELKISLNF